jgi:hypothetical protein
MANALNAMRARLAAKGGRHYRAGAEPGPQQEGDHEQVSDDGQRGHTSGRNPRPGTRTAAIPFS